MITYFLYFLNLIRLRWILSKKSSRFNEYTSGKEVLKAEETGLLPNENDWNNATPNLERKENISIVASNSIEDKKSALKLNLKWRPHAKLNLTTLMTRLSFELQDESYDYNEVTTYAPSKSGLQLDHITQYGSNGSSLKLFVLHPYVHYRIVFHGYMRKRSEPNELSFVKLNLLVFTTSRVFDFKEQFDTKNLARQMAAKRPSCGLKGMLDGLVLHDRHEHTVRLLGEYSIQDELQKDKVRDKLHLWGFHARHFLEKDQEQSQKIRSKRIFAHFRNGRTFHLALCENIRNNFDPSHQFTVGYGSFLSGAATEPLGYNEKQINWDQVNSSTLKLSFSVTCENLTYQVEAERRTKASDFLDMRLNNEPGWGAIVINDTFDSTEELYLCVTSLRDYQSSLEASEIVDPQLFESKEFSKDLLAVDLAKSESLYASLVGAKGASLAQLRALEKTNNEKSNDKTGRKFVVPRAVLLTRYAYEAIKEKNPNLVDEVKSLEARLGRGHLDGLEADCERLEKLFQSDAKMPASVREQLAEQLKASFEIVDLDGLDGRSFAVRSSSWGEDEEDMSAAGQLTTVLNVRGFEKLLAAVMECFASKFNRTNIEYKRQHGLPLDLPMAVVVQEMVACEKAGVLFTCDPATGDSGRAVITANYGLGESVVSGQTEPDTIKVRLSAGQQGQETKLAIESVLVGSKKVIMTENEQNGHQHDKSKCCLNDEEIQQVAKCGIQVSSYFQGPRDIEWGLKSGQLYLFQSRPVTGLEAYSEFELTHEGDQPSRAELEFTTRSNIGEVMPYAQTPIQISLATKAWAILSDQVFRVLKARPQDYLVHYSHEFIVWAYHGFFGLRGKLLFNFARQENGERSAISRAMEVGMFGHEVDDKDLFENANDMPEDASEARSAEWRFRMATWRSWLMPSKLNVQARKILERLRRDVHSLRYSKSGSTPEGLLEQLMVAFSFGRLPYRNHLSATMLSSRANFMLLLLLSKYIKEPVKLYSAFSKFLASSPNVLSAEIPRRTEKMAQLIKSQKTPEQMRSFVEMPPKEGLKFISSDMGSELAKEFDAFMVKFGHRCYNEFEISQLAWREKPERIIELLQTNVKSYLANSGESSGSKVEKKPSEASQLTTDKIVASLQINMSLLDRLLLKYVFAPRSQAYVSVREQTKDLVVMHCDILREAARMLARELRQNNRIPDEDLFFYLFFREIKPLVRGPQPSIVVQAAKRRRAFKQFEKAWHFDEIVKGYEMLPLHLKATKELDEKLSKAPKLTGTTASNGRVQGKVCLVKSYEELSKVKTGDILVAYSTDIAFSPVFPLVSGVITEIGGLISHGAVVAREYGLPSVIGIVDVTSILQDGEEIILDADNASIIRLSLLDQSAAEASSKSSE